MLILIDIDGTLLKSNHEIEEETKATIAKISNENRVILTSARKPSSTKSISTSLNLKEEIMICYNGALVVENGKNILECALTLEQALQICEIAREENISMNIYSGDHWYVEKIDDFVLREANIVSENPIIIDKWPENLVVHKILLIGCQEKLNYLKIRIKKIAGVSVVNSKSEYLEITSFLAKKGHAFVFLLNYLGWDVKKTLAIGDGYNDLELLQRAEIGIAMGNAPTAVKRKANYVTYSNDNNGVTHALKKFIVKG